MNNQTDIDQHLDKIICGDCEKVMTQFPKESIDLVVTSPPYDKIKNYTGFIFEFSTIAYELRRIIKEGGVVVWIVGDQTVDGSESGTSFRQALFFKEIGFNLHDTMIYHKFGSPLNHNRYEQHFEYMFILSWGKPKTFNPIMEKKLWKDNRKKKQYKGYADGTPKFGAASQVETKIAGNVWHYNVGGGHVTKDKIAHDHPAIMPEALAHDHIISWSNEGDIVLDPFIGSGTVAKMAYLNNRHYIGIDISPEYCTIAEERIRLAKQQPLLWERGSV